MSAIAWKKPTSRLRGSVGQPGQREGEDDDEHDQRQDRVLGRRRDRVGRDDAAAEDAILPLILFTLVFAFALTRLPAEPRARLVGFFQAVADTMLVVIGWVLWIAPIGVFALAYVVGARAGGAAFGALLHYVLIVTAVGVVSGSPPGRSRCRRRSRRSLHPRRRAEPGGGLQHPILAGLPAGDAAGAARLDMPVAASGVLLPMAVAIFRATGPAMNLAVAIYIAYWFGIELTPAQMAIGVAAAATTTMGAVGIPARPASSPRSRRSASPWACRSSRWRC